MVLSCIHTALACNSFLAIQQENLQTLEVVTSTYSSDMRNLIMYLLTNPTHLKTVNDLMPMIGARFALSWTLLLLTMISLMLNLPRKSNLPDCLDF